MVSLYGQNYSLETALDNTINTHCRLIQDGFPKVRLVLQKAHRCTLNTQGHFIYLNPPWRATRACDEILAKSIF